MLFFGFEGSKRFPMPVAEVMVEVRRDGQWEGGKDGRKEKRDCRS